MVVFVALRAAVRAPRPAAVRIAGLGAAALQPAASRCARRDSRSCSWSLLGRSAADSRHRRRRSTNCLTDRAQPHRDRAVRRHARARSSKNCCFAASCSRVLVDTLGVFPGILLTSVLFGAHASDAERVPLAERRADHAGRLRASAWCATYPAPRAPRPSRISPTTHFPSSSLLLQGSADRTHK